MEGNRYMIVDGIEETAHHIPEVNNADIRDTYLPDNFTSYCLCLKVNGELVGKGMEVTFKQHQQWLEAEKSTT